MALHSSGRADEVADSAAAFSRMRVHTASPDDGR
jgi:hypothetical protein